VIERSVIVAKGSRIRKEDLPTPVLSPQARSKPEAAVEFPVGTTVDEAERSLILKTLDATGQNKTKAAEILGISLKTLHNKLKKYRKTNCAVVGIARKADRIDPHPGGRGRRPGHEPRNLARSPDSPSTRPVHAPSSSRRLCTTRPRA
jgi:predicted DNA-binding protein (UPF0251 family)